MIVGYVPRIRLKGVFFILKMKEKNILQKKKFRLTNMQDGGSVAARICGA